MHVVRELGPELARRAERLAVDEPGLQYPVGRLVDGVVVGAALGRQRPLNAEGLEHQVDLGVVELAAAARAEHLDVRDRDGGRRERRLDQPGVLPGPGGVADDLPVAGVDEQADVVPRGPDAHVGQVAAYMGARRPAAEAARDDVGHVGLVDRPGVHLEPLPAVCADQAVPPHDVEGPATADGGGWRRRQPIERRVHLARAVPALAGAVEGRAPRHVDRKHLMKRASKRLSDRATRAARRRGPRTSRPQGSRSMPSSSSPTFSPPSTPAIMVSAKLPFSGNTSPHLARVLLFGEEGSGFFRNAFSILSSHIRFLASRSSRSSALGSGSPESSRRRLSAQSLTVLALSPSSSQAWAMGTLSR